MARKQFNFKGCISGLDELEKRELEAMVELKIDEYGKSEPYLAGTVLKVADLYKYLRESGLRGLYAGVRATI